MLDLFMAAASTPPPMPKGVEDIKLLIETWTRIARSWPRSDHSPSSSRCSACHQDSRPETQFAYDRISLARRQPFVGPASFSRLFLTAVLKQSRQ